MSKRNWTRHLWLAFGGLALSVLAAIIFTLGSLNAPVHPQSSSEFAILFSLTVFTFIVFLVFLFILIRSVVRLWIEHQIGRASCRERL